MEKMFFKKKKSFLMPNIQFLEHILITYLIKEPLFFFLATNLGNSKEIARSGKRSIISIKEGEKLLNLFHITFIFLDLESSVF